MNKLIADFFAGRGIIWFLALFGLGKPSVPPIPGPTPTPTPTPTPPPTPEPPVPPFAPTIVDDPIERFYTRSDGSTGSRWYEGWSRTPWVIVVHYSAGYDAAGCKQALESRGLSVHATIERDGVIHRHVDDSNRAIHAGYGRWGTASGLNSHALGFEIVNLGPLAGVFSGESEHFVYDPAPKLEQIGVDPSGVVYYRDESYTGSDGKKKTTTVLSRTVSERFTDHRPDLAEKVWETYLDEQLDAVFWLMWEWVKKYRILSENIVGHEHVTPHRKTDPGPSFPWATWQAFLEERLELELPELLDPKHNARSRVKAVQSHCSRLGLPVGEIDGWWGTLTHDAVADAVRLYGDTYAFSDVKITSDNCYAICNALRLVPGFDPGRG